MIRSGRYLREYEELVETLEVLEEACLTLAQSRLHGSRLNKMKDIMRQHFGQLERKSRLGFRR